VQDFISMADLKDRLMEEFFPTETSLKPVQVNLFKSTYPDDCFLFRPAEVTLWTGISSHGKTTFLSYLFVELAHMGERSFICSLEQKPEKIAKKQLLSLMKTPNIVPGHVEAFIDSLAERTCFCDKVGYIDQKTVLEMMEYAHRRYGVTQFMIDSLMRIEGLEEDYPAQGNFMNRLCEFAKKYGVHVHIVAHPRKTEGDMKPTANDLKGSSLLRNNADNILIISRNVEKEKRRRDGEIDDEEFDSLYDTKVEVDKDREEGRLKAFRYKFIHKYHYFEQIKTSPKPKVENVGFHKKKK
jgi:twinkle protein